MSAHTPGPWAVHPFYPGHVVPAIHLSLKVGGAANPEVDLREYAQVIVWVDPVHRHRERDEQVANARLIAAAPDLLEALRYARRFLRADDHDIAFVDAAIARATQP